MKCSAKRSHTLPSGSSSPIEGGPRAISIIGKAKVSVLNATVGPHRLERNNIAHVGWRHARCGYSDGWLPVLFFANNTASDQPGREPLGSTERSAAQSIRLLQSSTTNDLDHFSDDFAFCAASRTPSRFAALRTALGLDFILVAILSTLSFARARAINSRSLFIDHAIRTSLPSARVRTGGGWLQSGPGRLPGQRPMRRSWQRFHPASAYRLASPDP